MGGVGGKGGDVVFRVQTEKARNNPKATVPNLSALFKKVFKSDPKKQKVMGGNGGHSAQDFIMGEPGTDTVLDVPPGIILQTDEGKIIAELYEMGASVTVAKGGEGGGPNNAWIGSKGASSHVRLDLKLIADVGLVGFPNAGKSTLLKAISRARPKIASYPFTTIQPNLGTVQYEDLRTITVADLPGLIEGASYNVGMGHKFLKHVERTRLLLFVVDVHGFQFKPTSPHRSALETLLLLNKELELYKPDLLSKPAMLALTKMDLPGSEERREEVEKGWKEILEKGPSASGLPDDLLPTSLCHINETVAISAKFSKKSVGVAQQAMRHWVDESEEASRVDMEM